MYCYWSGTGVLNNVSNRYKKNVKKSCCFKIIIVDNNSATLNRKSLNKFKNLHLYINKKFTFTGQQINPYNILRNKYILILNNVLFYNPIFNFIFKNGFL